MNAWLHTRRQKLLKFEIGTAGFRSRCLNVANVTLFRLSYSPFTKFNIYTLVSMLTTGIEPATVGLLDQCSTDWATRATNNETQLATRIELMDCESSTYIYCLRIYIVFSHYPMMRVAICCETRTKNIFMSRVNCIGSAVNYNYL